MYVCSSASLNIKWNFYDFLSMYIISITTSQKELNFHRTINESMVVYVTDMSAGKKNQLIRLVEKKMFDSRWQTSKNLAGGSKLKAKTCDLVRSCHVVFKNNKK